MKETLLERQSKAVLQIPYSCGNAYHSLMRLDTSLKECEMCVNREYCRSRQLQNMYEKTIIPSNAWEEALIDQARYPKELKEAIHF